MDVIDFWLKQRKAGENPSTAVLTQTPLLTIFQSQVRLQLVTWIA